jgi:hypothetical protein
MRDKNNTNLNIESLLSHLGTEIAQAGSIMPGVKAQLPGVSMAPAHRMRVPLALVAGILAIGVATTLLLHRQKPADNAVAAADEPVANLEIDGVTIAQRLACIIGKRTVLVVWTCKGGNVILPTPKDNNRTQFGPAPYTEFLLRTDRMPDGSISCWTLFIAEKDRTVVMEPPVVQVRTANGQVCFGASPKLYSQADLDRAIQAAGLLERGGMNLGEIRDVLRRQGREIS